MRSTVVGKEEAIITGVLPDDAINIGRDWRIEKTGPNSNADKTQQLSFELVFSAVFQFH